jgi:polyisoprenoid-binding protein YceI
MKHFVCKTIRVIPLTLSLFSQPLLADWALDNTESELYFISTKKENISEVNQFTKLSGSISDDKKATLNINLSSVNTQVTIRDERLQKYLFETEKHTTAIATMDLSDETMKPGTHDINAVLSLHGVEQTIPAKVTVMENDGKLIVFTAAPIMLNTSAFKMDAGVAMLKKLAGLDRINTAVPITFTLNFVKEKDNEDKE